MEKKACNYASGRKLLGGKGVKGIFTAFQSHSYCLGVECSRSYWVLWL